MRTNTFAKQLKTKNLKVTPQRIAMLKLMESKGHMAVEELYDDIKHVYPSISLATIYKNILAMVDANILREIKAPGKKQKYELSMDKHIHVACERCGKLEDIHLEAECMIDECQRASGYEIHDTSAVFIGLCPQCARKM